MLILVNTDGSSAGNPGPAGIGVVLRQPPEDEGGLPILLREYGEPIGYATNNQAEYRALIRGLELAGCFADSAGVPRGEVELEVRCDSLVVVRQFLGEWKINDPALRALRRHAVALASEFRNCKLAHIYGVHNLDADRLAKKAGRRG